MNYKKQEEDTDKMKVVSIRRAFLDELKALEGWPLNRMNDCLSRDRQKNKPAVPWEEISNHRLIEEEREERRNIKR